MSEKQVKEENAGETHEAEIDPMNELTDDSLDREEDSVIDELADIVLSVDERDIKAVKSVLCLASPVFRAMLGPNFKENGESKLGLPGKTFESFKEFLDCFSPNVMRPVTVDNVYTVLPLVDEYQVEALRPICHNILLEQVTETSPPSEIYRHLWLAEKYNLRGALKEKCMYLASELDVARMKTCEQEYEVSTESQMRIKELALMMHDLLKNDDSYVMQRMLGISSNKTAQQALQIELWVLYRSSVFKNSGAYSFASKDRVFESTLPTEVTNCNALRVLRLCYRYLAHEIKMTNACVTYIRTLRESFTEEELQIYELLSERIKHDIRGRYMKTI